MTVTSAIERLERLDPNRALVAAVNATKDQFKELNESQWKEGVLNKKKESEQTRGYNAQYAKKRQKAGLQTNFMDYKYSGQFYEGYQATVEGGKIQMSSSVSYEPYLSKRDPELYGLTDENMVKYRAIVRPLIQADVKAQYHGGI